MVKPGGMLLNCDLVPADDGDEHDATLYMTPQEQLTALTAAGFVDCSVRLAINGMALYRGYVPPR